MTVWHEQDDFGELVPMFTAHHWEIAPEQVDFVVSVLELEPGGALVMQMMGKEVLARIFLPRDWQELPYDTSAQQLTAVARKAAS